MAEAGVAEIMAQRQRLREILVESQGPGAGTADLADLEGMSQPSPIMIALMMHEDLRLVLEAPEGRRVDDTVPVALEVAARGRAGFGNETPRGPGRIRGVGRAPALTV